MSYLTQSHITKDQAIIARLTACAASEGIHDPAYWAESRVWTFAAQPGWVAAYQSTADPEPGSDEDAITDTMIRDAVQALYEPPAPSE